MRATEILGAKNIMKQRRFLIGGNGVFLLSELFNKIEKSKKMVTPM